MKKNNTEQNDLSSRRKAIQTLATAALGFTIVPRHVLGGTGFTAPSDMINVGVVGVGGRGKENIRDLMALEDVRVTAIADPAEFWDLSRFYYRTIAGRGPVRDMIDDHYSSSDAGFSVAVYEDFREMLDKEDSLDAVLCATPDHLHAYVSILSMKAGKHVYCEKPLTHNIWEAREIKRLTRETGLATQMGNQLHSTEGVRKTVEYLRAGIIGDIKEVHAWVPASRWTSGLRGLPEGSSVKPYGFNWDLWLGPRSEREYHEVYTPVTWRDFWEFGCGAMGDFGCHDLDSAVWGLDLPLPASVELRPAGYSDSNITPHGEIGYFEFGMKDSTRPIKLTWYSGGLKPPHPALMPDSRSLQARGAMYIGTDGIMVSDGWGLLPKLYPESLSQRIEGVPQTLNPTNGHHRDWIDAIKGGNPASSNFEYAAHLTEITLLGVLSLRLGGRKFTWNAAEMKIDNMPAADQFIRESVREGWEIS
jgi:predicted dehydrogenase